MMTLDELVIEHEQRQNRWHGVRDLAPALVYVGMVMVAGLVIHWEACEPTVAFCAVCVGALAALLAMLKFWWVSERYDKAVQSRLQEVPDSLQLRAIAFYSSSDWQLAAIECHGAHLPGECPLCGAE